MQWAWRAYHADAQSTNTTFQPKISPKAKSLYGWIDLIVNGNNSLSICTSKLYEKYISLESIDRRTLHKYIIMLEKAVCTTSSTCLAGADDRVCTLYQKLTKHRHQLSKCDWN